MKKYFLLLILFLLLPNISMFNNFKKIEDHNHIKLIDRDKKLSATRPMYLINNATYYFYNLTQNYAKNYQGTCAYVATAMLLQYYDTMWDDNIIPSRFEVESISTESIHYRTSSPGIRTDKIPGLTDDQAIELTNSEYFDYVMNMSNSYFQPFLFKYVYENFGHNYIDVISGSFASLNEYGRECLINDYLKNYIGYSPDSYSIEIIGSDGGGVEPEILRQYVIQKVKQGIPVLVGGTVGVNGHACIAYDYDSSTDTIYLHWGVPFGSIPSPITAENDFIFRSATTLQFYGQHNHTNNYQLVTNGNVTYYCGCHLVTHKHVAHTIETYDDEFHIENCFCGYSKRDFHTCTGNFGRYENCTECGTLVDLWSVSTNAIIREEELEVA